MKNCRLCPKRKRWTSHYTICYSYTERISQGKTKILDSSIMDKIKAQDEELFGKSSEFKKNDPLEETAI